MRKLISVEKRTLVNKGDVYVISLKENNISPYRKDFNEALMGKIIDIDGYICRVVGIEAFATHESYEHSSIGLLVKPLS